MERKDDHQLPCVFCSDSNPSLQTAFPVGAPRDKRPKAKSEPRHQTARGGNPLQPSLTALYLLMRLQEHDAEWDAVKPAALVRLAKTYGRATVQTALGFLREELPEGIARPFAYLEAVCQRVREEEA